MAKHIRVAAVTVPPFSVGADVGAVLRTALAPLAAERTDLIVLPELCDIPKGLMAAGEALDAYLERRGESILTLLADLAREKSTYIAYNTLVPIGGGKKKNATRMIDRKGRVIGQYDKCYVTRAESEAGVVPGDGPVLFDCDFGRVAAIIGIDAEERRLRYLYARQKPAFTVHATRRSAGLVERFFAYNTRSYVVSAAEAAGTVILPIGDVTAEAPAALGAATARINLDCILLHGDGNGSRFGALRAKYGDRVPIYTPGNLGAHLITVEAPELTAADVIKEFSFEVLDDFIDRALGKRRELKVKE